LNGAAGPQWAPLVIIAVIALVLMFRMRRLTQQRPLRLEWLWVTPTLFLIVTMVAAAQSPPVGLDWLWLGVALAIGGGLGWYRGKMMHIAVDPETHALNAKASGAAIAFIIALVAIRYGLRYLAVGERLDAALITDGFLVFAVGLYGVQRLEMWLRARRLLTQARTARAAVGG